MTQRLAGAMAELLGSKGAELDREVPCMDCGALVMCLASTWELARMFNHMLVRSHKEDYLRKDELVRCPGCSRRWREEQARIASRQYWKRVDIREARKRVEAARRTEEDDV